MAKLRDQLLNNEKTNPEEQPRDKKTSIHYPSDLYQKIKIKTSLDGITIRKYILDLIEEDLKNDPRIEAMWKEANKH